MTDGYLGQTQQEGAKPTATVSYHPADLDLIAQLSHSLAEYRAGNELAGIIVGLSGVVDWLNHKTAVKENGLTEPLENWRLRCSIGPTGNLQHSWTINGRQKRRAGRLSRRMICARRLALTRLISLCETGWASAVQRNSLPMS